jgi:A/G-specific adenine glycosylase
VGVWGGLWCFPEARTDAEGILLQPIEHGFTHFRLRIHPLLCDLRRKSSGAESPGRLWIDIAQATRAAVPAPVKTLLLRLL